MAILKAEEEFFDRIWYDRKLVLQDNVKRGRETIDPEIKKGTLAAMKRVEASTAARRLSATTIKATSSGA